MPDIQVLEAREKFCAKRKKVLLKKKIFSLEENFSFGAERFLYVSFLNNREARGRGGTSARDFTDSLRPTQRHTPPFCAIKLSLTRDLDGKN